MSQADALLNSLTDDQIALYSGTGNSEPHIVIGADRRITVPDSLKRIAVEADHNVETVTFDCPRYWDNHDLSQMILYINVKLPNGSTISHIAENISASGDTMTFTWTITRTITAQKGNIIFLVCAKKTETKEVDGEEKPIETVHWNTELCNDMYVSEGLEADLIVEEEYPDIVNQLLTDMAAVKAVEDNMNTMLTAANTAKTAAETAETEAKKAKGAAETAAKTVSDNAAEIRNSYANAIKGNVSGEIVRVDDVSPLEHTVNVVVRSKNLWPSIKSGSTATLVGVTLTHNTDGSISLTGTATSSTNFKVGDMYLPSGKYYLCDFADGEFPDNTFARSQIYSYDTLESLSVHNYRESNFVAGTDTILSEGTYECRIRITEGVTYDATLYPTLFAEKYGYPTEYEPYINPDEVEVIRYGKNLVDSAQYITPRTVNGVTVQYLPNEDAFLFNGTATSAARIGYSQLIGACEGEQFTCTIIPISGSVDKGTADYPPVIFFGKSDTRTGAGTNNISFQLTDTKTTLTQRVSGKYLKDSWFWISVGNILTNYKVRIQFERGNIATEYEQYQGRSTDADGIKSVSPTMTIFTDTPGAIVDVTYNRDTTKMFESYVLTDNAKSEIAGIVKDEISAEIDAIEDCLDEIIAIQESLL